jgi:4-hydroxyphenylpyruvate dioxygenase-like putative hemolysin
MRREGGNGSSSIEGGFHYKLAQICSVRFDHLTHNVGRGRMDVWAGFYERLFNFRQIRYFDIKGEYTGLFSRALTSQPFAPYRSTK